jgi:hypothetical protein
MVHPVVLEDLLPCPAVLQAPTTACRLGFESQTSLEKVSLVCQAHSVPDTYD